MKKRKELTAAEIRYEAMWIAAQPSELPGDWKYTFSYHQTRDAAESAAIRESKRADQAEWILVAEQEFRNHTWVDVRRWTGDWDGLHEETYASEEA